MRNGSSVLLWLAAIGGIGIGGYHFFLPIQFRWLDDIHPAHGMVAWGLLMVNACFSTLLILGSLMLAFAARSDAKDPMARVVVAGMAIFWAMNTIYQFVAPMPVPKAMVLVSHSLQFFAFVMFVCSFLPLMTRLGTANAAKQTQH